MASESNVLALPATVIGPSDVARLKRDLETLDDHMHQASLRAKAAGKKAPAGDTATKQLITALAEANKADLEDRDQRRALIAGLDTILEHAPTVTLSLAIDPSAAFLSKIVQWLRSNTQPNVLVRTSLQPNIVAGCRLRTPSKLYDFSLRNKFDEQRPLLIESLHRSAQGPATPQATEAAA